MGPGKAQEGVLDLDGPPIAGAVVPKGESWLERRGCIAMATKPALGPFDSTCSLMEVLKELVCSDHQWFLLPGTLSTYHPTWPVYSHSLALSLFLSPRPSSLSHLFCASIILQ